MNSQDYLNYVKSKFNNKTEIRYESTEMLIAYEQIFKWKWQATKLKITSFVKCVPQITLDDIKSYSEICLKEAIMKKKGLPRGFQNGVLSYNVLVSDNVSPEAIAFVMGRPEKHFSAFEVPIIFDLSNNNLYFYQGNVIWGMMYNSFIKNYLFEHFNPAV